MKRIMKVVEQIVLSLEDLGGVSEQTEVLLRWSLSLPGGGQRFLANPRGCLREARAGPRGCRAANHRARLDHEARGRNVGRETSAGSPAVSLPGYHGNQLSSSPPLVFRDSSPTRPSSPHQTISSVRTLN